MREIDDHIPPQPEPIPPATESPDTAFHAVETTHLVETLHATSLPNATNQPGWNIHPVGFAFALLATSFAAYQLLGGVITYFLFGLDMSANVQGMRIATIISQVVFLVGPAVLLLYLQPWEFRKVFRLAPPRLLPLGVAVLAVISVQFVGSVYLDVQQHILRRYLLPDMLLPLLDSFEKMVSEMYETLLIMRSPGEALFVLLVVGVTPAVCEEVLFRGSVLYSLERGLRVRWALLITGSMFALFHLNPVTFVPLALLGTWLGFIVWRGGSIWYAVIGHAVNNSLAVFSLYVLETDSLTPKVVPGAMPDGLTLLVGAVSLGVFIFTVLWFWRLTRPQTDSISLQ